jgi:site-specific DNA-methyltransferase (cytosine-N4-specific)
MPKMIRDKESSGLLTLFPVAHKTIPSYKTGSLCAKLEHRFSDLIQEELEFGSLISYIGNRKIPILRLYRYKEAFAYGFVKEFIHRFGLNSADYLLDPFAGMGTTCFTAMMHGIPSVGIDKLPIAAFIAKTIPLFLFLKPNEIKNIYKDLVTKLNHSKPAPVAMDVPIMKIAFSEHNLLELRKWKTVIDTLDEPYKSIFLLLFFAIIEPCSYTSKDGQFLRYCPDKTLANPTEALFSKVCETEIDIENAHKIFPATNIRKNLIPQIYNGDTRDLSNVKFQRTPTAIFTSPPYANRYDYSRSYSLELCFHFVKNFEELKAVRFGILRSHIESKVAEEEKPTHPAIAEVVTALRHKELNNPRIPYMITGYFNDMAQVITEWYNVLAKGAKVAMVVDNVRYEGEMIPVDLVLSDIAEEIGFRIKEILVTRYKGNSSQQMKKYGRIPVRESIVIWEK